MRTRVGRHHPLQCGDSAAERMTDTIDRDVDDRDVEPHHTIAEAHCGKCQIPARALLRSDFKRCGHVHTAPALYLSRVDRAATSGSQENRLRAILCSETI